VSPTYQGVTVLLLVAALAAVDASGATGLASLGAVVLILLRAMTYSQTVQQTYHSVFDTLPFVEVVRDTQGRYEEAAMPTQGAPLGEITQVRFDRVSFSYVPGRPVLREISVEVGRGEVVGVVGPSGAGKSTFVQLLLQLRAPNEGAISVNGRTGQDYQRSDWFSRVAYVPQDSRLIDGTVTENIRFFRPWITESDILRAAQAAHIHDEILVWANGYESAIGQRADAISGGQRQRICLARALAGKPDLLVLDEPTSALDLQSEKLVQRSLEDLKGQLTMFIVAHRLSTLNTCDRLLVFVDGRLEAVDKPGILLESNEFYREAVSLSQTLEHSTAPPPPVGT
jgi:ABC-type multidrug transport system fused ATPase/permease subunit